MKHAPRKLVIVGGEGGMGSMLARFLQSLGNYQITLFDRQHWHTPEKLAQQDAVLISVPIRQTEQIIKQVIPYLDPGTLLADFTSIKTGPLSCMLEHYDGPVVGLHPIFGPHIPHASQQVIVCCDGRYPEQYQWFVEDLKACGFSLEMMSAEEHDEAMSFIQGIEHFSTYCLGRFLAHNNVNLSKLSRIASPVYQFALNVVGRLFDQDPELYADIIMADQNRIEHINAFVEFIGCENRLVQTRDREEFIRHFKAIREWMGDFTTRAYRDSDALLNRMPK